MGARWSNGKDDSEEDPVSYDKLYQLRSKLFPDIDTKELLKNVMKDESPTLVYSDDTGFRLYIGSAMHAQNISLLKDTDISYIVNMAAGTLYTGEEFYGEGFHCLMISAEDMEEYDLSQHFSEVSEFIEEARMGGAGALVHCMAGVSRSVTATVAYLMKCNNMPLIEAAKQVHTHRRQAYPNIGFIQNLTELDRELKMKRLKQ